jgi:CDP-diglyceride synthetase
MITGLMRIAQDRGGLVLIVIVFAAAGIILGLIGGYLMGVFFGKNTGRTMHSLKESIDALNITLKGFRLRIKEPRRQ